MKRLIQLLVSAALPFSVSANAERSEEMPNQASESVINNPYSPLYPTPYKSLSDVPEQHHDGEGLSGCFVGDSKSGSHYHSPVYVPTIHCFNPFYRDELCNLRRLYRRHGLPPEPLPPIGAPRNYKPAPCQGCLNEEQVIDIFQVYHREIGIEPLGYRAAIIEDFPWDGRSSIDSRDCGRIEPYPDLSPYEKVNLPRKRRPFTGFNQLGEKCRDPQNRDLNWRVRFQIGWFESQDVQRKVDRGSYHKSALTKDRVPCIASHIIHTQTGVIRGRNGKCDVVRVSCTEGTEISNLDNFSENLSLDDHYGANYKANRRMLLHLPQSPVRKYLKPTVDRTKKPRGRLRERDPRQSNQEGNELFRHSTTAGSREQHILVN